MVRRPAPRPWAIAPGALVALMLLLPGLAGAAAGLAPGSPHGPPPLSRAGRIGTTAGLLPASARAAARRTPGASPERSTATEPSWYNVTRGMRAAYDIRGGSPTPPPGVVGGAFASDANGSVAALYGGWNGTTGISRATWVYSLDPGRGPATWISVTRSTGPPALAYASLVFDEDMNEFVLFGGEEAGGSVSNATWILDPSDWSWTNAGTPACVLACPSARANASFAWAPSSYDDAAILFGGCPAGCRSYLNDTWAYTNSSGRFFWIRLSPGLSPSPRAGAPFAAYWDPGGLILLLFGGQGTGGALCNDTWEFYNGHWTNLTGDTAGAGPAARVGASMVFDWAIDGIVMTGGLGASGAALADTWELSCDRALACSWTSLATGGAGVGMAYGAASTLDPYADPLIFGGEGAAGGGASATLWVLQNSTAFRENVSTLTPELGQTVAFNASLLGGAANGGVADGGYSYWTVFSPAGVTTPRTIGLNGTYPTLVQAFASVGTWIVNVSAVDAWDVGGTSSWRLVVGAPSLAISVADNATDVGVPDRFVATAAGRLTAPWTVAWVFGDGGLAGSESSNTTLFVNHTYNSSGNYSAVVTVTDALGNAANATLNVTVHPAPRVVALASSMRIAANGSVEFFPELSGGSAPFTFLWNFGDGSPTSSAPDPSHAYASPGSFRASVNVTDRVGRTGRANLTIIVNGALNATATATPSVAPLGTSIAFAAAPTGGNGNYTVEWLFGDGNGSSGTAVTHRYAAPGNFTVVLWVNDTSGASKQLRLGVEVTGSLPRRSSGSTSSGTPGWLTGLEIIAGILVVAAAAAVVLRRRGGASPPASAGGELVEPPSEELPPSEGEGA